MAVNDSNLSFMKYLKKIKSAPKDGFKFDEIVKLTLKIDSINHIKTYIII